MRPEVTGHYKKIPSLYLRKYLLAIAGNLKVNEQTKYKSVPNLLFLAAWLSRESQKYGIIEFFGVKIDTSHINFLKAQLSLDRPVQFLFCKILNHFSPPLSSCSKSQKKSHQNVSDRARESARTFKCNFYGRRVVINEKDV